MAKVAIICHQGRKFSTLCAHAVWDSLLCFALFSSLSIEWKSFNQIDRKVKPFWMSSESSDRWHPLTLFQDCLSHVCTWLKYSTPILNLWIWFTVGSGGPITYQISKFHLCSCKNKLVLHPFNTAHWGKAFFKLQTGSYSSQICRCSTKVCTEPALLTHRFLTI